MAYGTCSNLRFIVSEWIRGTALILNNRDIVDTISISPALECTLQTARAPASSTWQHGRALGRTACLGRGLNTVLLHNALLFILISHIIATYSIHVITTYVLSSARVKSIPDDYWSGKYPNPWRVLAGWRREIAFGRDTTIQTMQLMVVTLKLAVHRVYVRIWLSVQGTYSSTSS